ncbi:methyltransferase family protein [Lentzea atacamensis]|uniref:Methyltransferase family protein n=1 Tax=Lentzea atacamensis TaxID=531938 RepID=A0ABX9EC40_9PSEU|nr:class I SAM-dependent methyltransferase [Lentzea atacamensis]RAS67458.1 methyltransferase family protein [Lentzea atacamensis]
MTSEPRYAAAYNDSNVLFRVLRHVGWGDLVNVGYFTLPTLPIAVTGLGWFQRRLLRRSLSLLDVHQGQRVLDAGCGRGLGTAWLARRGCEVLGVDVEPDQVQQARHRFGDQLNARFAVADVTALPARVADVALADESFDRVHCLEAAFHFGPEGRRAFLTEAFRLLRPGGRLVLVDFTWPEPDPGTINGLDPHRLVRDTWRFEELEPLDRYLDNAVRTGFIVHAVHDWTRPVVRRPLQHATLVTHIVSTAVGRTMLRLRWPGLRELNRQDWRAVTDRIRAMRAVGAKCGYSALVLDKPACPEPA